MKVVRFIFNFYLILILTLLSKSTPLLSQNNQKTSSDEFGLARAANLGGPINTSNGEFAPTISADGKTLIFESDRDAKYKWKLYITHKTKKKFLHTRESMMLFFRN